MRGSRYNSQGSNHVDYHSDRSSRKPNSNNFSGFGGVDNGYSYHNSVEPEVSRPFMISSIRRSSKGVSSRDYRPSNQEPQSPSWQTDHYGSLYSVAPDDNPFTAPLYHHPSRRQLSEQQDYSPHVSEGSDGSYRGVLLGRTHCPLTEPSPCFPESTRSQLMSSSETSGRVHGRKYSTNSVSSDSDQPLPSIQETVLFPSTGQVGFRRSNLWMQSDSASFDDDPISYHDVYSPQTSLYNPREYAYHVDSPYSHPYGADSQDSNHITPDRYYASADPNHITPDRYYTSSDPFFVDGSLGSFSDDRSTFDPENSYCHSDYLPPLGLNDEGLRSHSYRDDSWRASADPMFGRDSSVMSEDPLAYRSSLLNGYSSTLSDYSNPNRIPTDSSYQPQSSFSSRFRGQDQDSFSRLLVSKENNEGNSRSPPEQNRRGSQSKTRRNNELNGSVLKERLEYAVQLKKQGDIDQARVIMEGLWKESPSSIPVILELVRLNMDSGAFMEARSLIQQALETRGDDDLLLERSLRVEERIGNLSGILHVIGLLIHSRKYRNVKTVVDACMTVAKLGGVHHSQQIFQYLIDNDHCKQGNLILNYILFVYRSISLDKAYEQLHSFTGSCFKHGPLWFFSFEVFEHRMVQAWNGKSMDERIHPMELLSAYSDSLKALSSELRWKVFYMATQMYLRTITDIRIATFKNMDLMDDYLRSSHQVLSICRYYLQCALQLCSDNLKWKIWLLIARTNVFAGSYNQALKCFERSIRVTPYRNSHSLYFEISRLMDYGGHTEGAKKVIMESIRLVPGEWKLSLERIQQLLRCCAIRDALALNRRVVTENRGAGRLWASLIHIIHQYCGPYLALFVFMFALQYVAKSGEVWCEGGRIFLNPCSSFFSLHNAKKCLNLAVYFTPQYGDSFIECLRLDMLLSNEFITLSSTVNSYFLYAILISRDYRSIISHCQYSDPNYGSCWFKAKVYPLGSAEEVMVKAIKCTAWDLCCHAEKYYYAMKQAAMRCKKGHNLSLNCMFRYFTFAFKPDHMFNTHEDLSAEKKMMLLFGTSQIEA